MSRFITFNIYEFDSDSYSKHKSIYLTTLILFLCDMAICHLFLKSLHETNDYLSGDIITPKDYQ